MIRLLLMCLVVLPMLVGCSAPMTEPVAELSDSPLPTPSSEPERAVITDTGAREGAMGVWAPDANGVWVYTVVEGDVGGIICDRFGRDWWQLETLDGRDGFDCHTMIVPGELLTPTDATLDEVEGD